MNSNNIQDCLYTACRLSRIVAYVIRLWVVSFRTRVFNFRKWCALPGRSLRFTGYTIRRPASTISPATPPPHPRHGTPVPGRHYWASLFIIAASWRHDAVPESARTSSGTSHAPVCRRQASLYVRTDEGDLSIPEWKSMYLQTHN